MIIQTQATIRYHIIESNIGPLISESRVTVYDVLEAQNLGHSLYQISMERNLTPLQVQVAFDYIEQQRERLQAELKEILKAAAERKQLHDTIATEKDQIIAQLPMTPQREAFYALKNKHLKDIKARKNADDS